MRIPVVVDCRDRYRLRYHFRLRRFGLDRGTEHKYRGLISKRRLERLEAYCRENHLKYYIDNRYGTRDSGYRSRFLAHDTPVLGCFYFCAYCGRPVSKKRVTVDHLYPVAKVSRDLELQKKLRRQGIDDLNSEKNLVPACYRCNQAKGAQMGAWIRRGKIGRHAWVWAVRWFCRLLLLAAVLYVCYQWYHAYHDHSFISHFSSIVSNFAHGK